MPEVEVEIGGRKFAVACQPGEEAFLRAAAQMLDTEARPLVAQLGRLPEARMLLMAGLMLADRTASIEDEMRALRARLAEMEAEVRGPAVPAALAETLAELAARAEALAAQIEERAS